MKCGFFVGVSKDSTGHDLTGVDHAEVEQTLFEPFMSSKPCQRCRHSTTPQS